MVMWASLMATSEGSSHPSLTAIICRSALFVCGGSSHVPHAESWGRTQRKVESLKDSKKLERCTINLRIRTRWPLRNLNSRSPTLTTFASAPSTNSVFMRTVKSPNRHSKPRCACSSCAIKQALKLSPIATPQASFAMRILLLTVIQIEPIPGETLRLLQIESVSDIKYPLSVAAVVGSNLDTSQRQRAPNVSFGE